MLCFLFICRLGSTPQARASKLKSGAFRSKMMESYFRRWRRNTTWFEIDCLYLVSDLGLNPTFFYLLCWLYRLLSLEGHDTCLLFYQGFVCIYFLTYFLLLFSYPFLSYKSNCDCLGFETSPLLSICYYLTYFYIHCILEIWGL